MRLAAISAAMFASACASAPTFGPLGEGSVQAPTIVAVDSAIPPSRATIRIGQPGYVALLLVAPGHSATLLYPRDSLTSNRFDAGTHQLSFQIPPFLVMTDSARLDSRGRDTSRIMVRRPSRSPTVGPLSSETPTFLLLVTSPQELSHRRIIEKTAGVSIPLIEMEALNAVGKAIKSTIPAEPRDWAGYYRLVELRQRR